MITRRKFLAVIGAGAAGSVGLFTVKAETRDAFNENGQIIDDRRTLRFVDYRVGNDANDGLSQETAWQSLANVAPCQTVHIRNYGEGIEITPVNLEGPGTIEMWGYDECPTNRKS